MDEVVTDRDRIAAVNCALCESELELDLEVKPDVDLVTRIERIAKAAQRRRLSPRHYRLVHWLATRVKPAVV
jgi:hypothetical protein